MSLATSDQSLDVIKSVSPVSVLKGAFDESTEVIKPLNCQ